MELLEPLTSHYIFISSASVYLKPPPHWFITEKTPVGNPFWSYAQNKIACEDSDLLAAFAPVVASMGYNDVTECLPSKPMPLVMVSGGADNNASREATFHRWVELNG